MGNFYKFTFIILLSLRAVAQVPSITITSTTSVFCTGTSQGFSVASTQSLTAYSWSVVPARYVAYESSVSDAAVTFTPSNPGTYTVILRAATTESTYLVTKTFNVTRSASASFNASLSGQGFPSKLTLTNYSSNSLKNYWIFDGNVNEKDSSATVIKNYPASGNYSVLLIAIGLNGCNDQSVYTFRVADSSGVTLPNVFSPNNDGINDIFRPEARGIVNLNAWVYNRNGVIITSWDKVSGFWDGHTTSGEPCTAGEYFVVVEATGFDGKQYKLKGNITLIR